jgi:hypothetical protein
MALWETPGDIEIEIRWRYDHLESANDERPTKVPSNLLINDRKYTGVPTMYNDFG